MEVKFKTVTPLHIGNGEVLNSLDYIKYNSIYYRINQKQFISFIGNDPALIEKYNNWVVDNSGKIDNLEQEKKDERDRRKKQDFNQQLSILRKAFNLLNFIERNTRFKQDFLKFLNDTDDIAKIKFTIEPKDQVRGLIKTANNITYVPGTSLKGAIRTALLFHFLTHSDKNQVEQILKDNIQKFIKSKNEFESKNRGKRFPDRFIDKFRKTFADRIEQMAFYCPTINDRGITKNDDEKFDILKFLSLSDATVEKSGLMLANIDLYLISKIKDRQSGRLEEIATRQLQAPCVEAIPENSYLRTDINFNIEFLLSLKGMIQNDQVMQGNSIVWMGLRKKVKDVFNIDIEEITKENIEEKREDVFDHIFNCLKEFSANQLEVERKWIKDFSEKDKTNQYKSKILSGYRPVFSSNGILLHFGYASGFYGITEFLFLRSDDNLKALFKQVMELFGIGDKPGADRNRREGEKYMANPDKFPKSRRLIDINNVLKPLGWIQLVTDNHLDETAIPYAVNCKEVETRIPEETIKTQYFTGKLKSGAGPIDAEVINSGVPNFVRLFVEGYFEPIEMRGYNSPLDAGTIVQVKINNITGKGEIKQVGFIKVK